MSDSSTLANQRSIREIPEDQWIPFLAEFTRVNRGAHARLEIIGADKEAGYYVETEDRPFDGVSADTKDRERTVWITFGAIPAEHMAHSIPSATLIRTLPETGNSGAVLEVEARDGSRTLLELTRPETYALPPAEPR